MGQAQRAGASTCYLLYHYQHTFSLLLEVGGVQAGRTQLRMCFPRRGLAEGTWNFGDGGWGFCPGPLARVGCFGA